MNKLNTKDQIFEEVIRNNFCKPTNYKDIGNYDLKTKLKQVENFNKEEIIKYFF